MANVKYDTSGSAYLTKIIDTLLNQFPGWGNEEVVFSFVEEESGVGWFPVSGAIIESEKKTICGEVKQKCQYPFFVLYRMGKSSESTRISVKEKLDMLGAWLEQQEVIITGEKYRLKSYPDTGDRKIKSIRRTTPAYNSQTYDNGIYDWVVYITVQYENNYFE